MSNIDKRALREELSNPAIGSNAHLRKLALALLDELEALQSFRTAFNEWHDKTEWVQGDKRFDVIKPWGKHRADVLKLYIDHLESKLEAKEEQRANWFQMAQKLGEDLDAAEKQIAEMDVYRARRVSACIAACEGISTENLVNNAPIKQGLRVLNARIREADGELEALRQRIAELDNSLCELLPGTQYMDPPDGGNVTPLEQVRRMIADYRHRIAELEAAKQDSAKWFKAFEKAVSIGARYEERIAELREWNAGLAQESFERQQRIAELEERTPTVKMPEPFKLAKSSSGLTYYYADEVDKALAAASINVEAE